MQHEMLVRFKDLFFPNESHIIIIINYYYNNPQATKDFWRCLVYRQRAEMEPAVMGCKGINGVGNLLTWHSDAATCAVQKSENRNI